MRWRSRRSRSPLSPLLRPEMTRCAALPLPPCRAVLMRFDRDDDLNLNDHPKTWNLPDGALALLTRAAEWCAHNLKYGFVPAEMLARFSSDPVQAVEELLRRGLWRRVKGGYQFCEWELFGKTADQAAGEEAAAEAKRAYDAERQRRSRANRKAAVAAMSHVTSCDADIDRSDQDLSISPKSKSGSRSKSARAKGPAAGSQEFRDRVTAKFAEMTEIWIDAATADAIAADVLGAREGIENPLPYVLRAIAREADPVGRWLPGRERRARPEPGPLDWCGECDEIYRTRENGAGQVYDCPNCSTKSFAAWEAIAQ